MTDAPQDIPASTLQAPSDRQVERAIRLSYAQVLCNAVFAASTGGMFLIGFAMRLGADNVWLGLISTIPALFVVFQFLSAYAVERGVSRKKITVALAFVTPACWVFIASIPLLAESMSITGRMLTLTGVIALVTLAAQVGGNARASWVGELIPDRRRGRFFGYSMMFGGIVGAMFAIAEGRFLDMISRHGLLAFTSLFFFGCLFGLASAGLNIPQADCPLPGAHLGTGFFRQVRQTLSNRPFMRLAMVHMAVAMGGIAGPFNAAYLLRDVGMSYFQLGLLNSLGTVAMLLSSGLWGRLVDRFGCRPVLIVGLCMMAPTATVWLFIPPGAVSAACWLLPFGNFISGAGGAAFGVAITTGMYKLSSPHGRSIQFATYSVLITLLSAPMPALGGLLVTALQHAHLAVDLRLTFALWSAFMCLAAVLALGLREKGSLLARSLVIGYFPGALDQTLRWAASAVGDFFGAVVRIGRDDPDEPQPPERPERGV
jgi:MFS family permease